MADLTTLTLTLDACRPLLEEAASDSGLTLDFLMREWNGRFATFNVGIPTETVVDPRRGVRDEARHYKLLGRVKAVTNADGLRLSLTPPTACDLTPSPEEEALWNLFTAALLTRLAPFAADGD